MTGDIKIKPLNSLERIALGVTTVLGIIGVVGEAIALNTRNYEMLNNTTNILLTGVAFGAIAALSYDFRGALYR